MTVIETLKYPVTPGETVSLCALKFELTEEDSSAMSTQLLASELLNLGSSTKVKSQSDKVKSSTKYAIVYWREMEEFKVMPLSRILEDKREQSAPRT